MDERIRDHAEVLVDWSARIEAGDDVVVRVDDGAHELAVAVAEALGERGATPMWVASSAEYTRSYLRAVGDREFETPEHRLAASENADAVLSLSGGHNTAAMADVPDAIRRRYGEAAEPVRDARLATRWVSTVHPTRSLAQQAGMSIEAYREFVYDAVLRDWAALAEEMSQLKERLNAGETVRIVAEGTDLTMSIADRTAVNSCASVAYGSHNLPSGEVFTAPVADSVAGEVTFDVPITVRGREIEDVRLVFENGEVVDHGAARGADVVAEILDTDEGARRLGELGIGMNRGIDRPTGLVLFDEKMGGTVHLALGRAYDANVPEGETGNESTVHVDLIAEMGSGSRLEIDGEPIQADGTFVWE